MGQGHQDCRHHRQLKGQWKRGEVGKRRQRFQGVSSITSDGVAGFAIAAANPTTHAARWMAPRKLRAAVSWRVAMARYSLVDALPVRIAPRIFSGRAKSQA